MKPSKGVTSLFLSERTTSKVISLFLLLLEGRQESMISFSRRFKWATFNKESWEKTIKRLMRIAVGPSRLKHDGVPYAPLSDFGVANRT
jgi:hypothetical protein